MCQFAGEGATLAFEGKRLNYSCGQAGEEEIGLIGDFQLKGLAMTAEKAAIGHDTSGFVLNSSEIVCDWRSAVKLKRSLDNRTFQEVAPRTPAKVAACS
jgi:hypothetical protein